MIAYYTLIFFISLFLGSFYNVVALRELSGENISLPASHCTSCNHKLGPLDLFPLLSYVFLGGRCRYCKDKISYIYPLGEFLTAISYTIVIYIHGFSLEALTHIVFLTILIICTVCDLKEMIVPDKFIIVGLISVGLLKLIDGYNPIFLLINGGASFLILYAIFIASRNRLGGADVKIYALIGVSIGIINALSSLFYASIVAIIIIIPLSIINKSSLRKEIAFFPFITIGVMLVYFGELNYLFNIF